MSSPPRFIHLYFYTTPTFTSPAPSFNFYFVLSLLSPLYRDTGDILLKICNLMPQDTGIYTCVAVNDHGSASSSASIKVQGNMPGLKVAFHIQITINKNLD